MDSWNHEQYQVLYFYVVSYTNIYKFNAFSSQQGT